MRGPTLGCMGSISVAVLGITGILSGLALFLMALVISWPGALFSLFLVWLIWIWTGKAERQKKRNEPPGSVAGHGTVAVSAGVSHLRSTLEPWPWNCRAACRPRR